MDMSFFTNEKYKILACMQERQIDVMGRKYVPLSQRQIAEITEISYKTVNNAIKELKDKGYVSWQGTTRGKYSLTDKAISALGVLQKGDAEE